MSAAKKLVKLYDSDPVFKALIDQAIARTTGTNVSTVVAIAEGIEELVRLGYVTVKKRRQARAAKKTAGTRKKRDLTMADAKRTRRKATPEGAEAAAPKRPRRKAKAKGNGDARKGRPLGSSPSPGLPVVPREEGKQPILFDE